MPTRLEKPVIDKTTDHALNPTLDRPGIAFSNRGATGPVVFTLPAPNRALQGWWWEFRIVEPFAVTVRTLAPGGLVASSAVGQRLDAWCDGKAWLIVADVGSGTGGGGGGGTPDPHGLTHETGGSDALRNLDGAVLTTGLVEDARLPDTIVRTTDPRLSDQRLPVLHAPSHALGGADPVTLDQTQVAGLAASLDGKADDTDPRFSDARPPTVHGATHQPGGSDPMPVDAAAAVGSLRTLGGGALQALPGNDARLGDARTPKPHAPSHANGSTDPVDVKTLAGYPGGSTGFLRADATFAVPPGGGGSGTLEPHAPTHKASGTDPIRLDELDAPTDNVVLNVSSATHGLTPKLSGNPAQYLSGIGTYTAPPTVNHAGRHWVGAADPLDITRLSGYVGNNAWFLRSDGAWAAPPSGGGGTGDVVGPASATGDALALFNGLTGKLIKDSLVLVTDVARRSQNNIFTGFNRIDDHALLFFESDQPVDQRNWAVGSDGGLFTLSPITDAGTGLGPIYFAVTRLGDFEVSRDGRVLRNLIVTGTITGDGGKRALTVTGGFPGGTTDFLRADGTFAVPPGGGVPGGLTTQVQFNDGGAFGGDTMLLWDKGNDRLGIGAFPDARLSVKQSANARTGGLRLTRSDAAGFGDVYMGADDKLYVQVLTTGSWFEFRSDGVLHSTGGLSTGGTGFTLTADGGMKRNTADGSDTGSVGIGGGGALSASRGAVVTAFGNEVVSGKGWASIELGLVAGAQFAIWRNNQLGLGFDGDTGDLFAATGPLWTIRRNTTDGADNHGIALAGGGAQNQTRGGVLSAFGNEYGSGYSGLVLAEIGNVAGAQFRVNRGSGATALSVAGDTGAVSFTTTYEWGATFNFARTDGGFLSILRNGTYNLVFGNAKALGIGGGAQNDDAAVLSYIASSKLYLEAAAGGSVRSLTIYGDPEGVPANMVVDADGRMRRATSSARYKAAIAPLTDWQWLLNLTPVEYATREKPDGRKWVGLTAEDVAAHSPVRNGVPMCAGLNDDGQPEDVTYANLVAPLLLAVKDLNRRLAALES